MIEDATAQNVIEPPGYICPTWLETRETDSAVVRPTQSEDVTEPGGRLVEPVLAYAGREVVTVVSVSEIRESDAVLDVDSVLVRPGD